MSVWSRIAKEKYHVYWVVPILNLALLLATYAQTLYLVVKGGNWEAAVAAPLIAILIVLLWYLGKKKLLAEEISYNWSLSKQWAAHEKSQEEVIARLNRIEEKIA